MLNELLRSELLGENIDPSAPGNIAVPYQGRNSAGGPLREGGNHFQYQSPRQAYHSSVVDSLSPAVVDSFSLTPVGSAASQRLMSTPQKRKRRIQKVPFKVLDAPALQDDFYLNLVDW
jgi:cell division cycle 20-like protein 1 (cofactor of APC complex)